jgi:Polyketide cyclase / dehydrase and lipid transport
MTQVKTSMRLSAPASDVWKAIGRFDALPSWHPLVKSTETEKGGTVRHVSTPAGEFVEELEESDDNSRTYRYQTTDSPLPIGNAHASLRVREEGDDAVVEWEGDFEPAAESPSEAISQASTTLRDLFQSGLDNLTKMFGRGTS